MHLMQMIRKVAQLAHTSPSHSRLGRGLGPIFSPAGSEALSGDPRALSQPLPLNIYCPAKVHRQTEASRRSRLIIRGQEDWCLFLAGPRMQLATHTHPDVVGIDVVSPRHILVHVTQHDTGGINWGGKMPLRSPGRRGCLWTLSASLPADPW